MEDLKASRLAEVIQDSGIMFQVMTVRGKKRILIDIYLSLNWNEFHAVAPSCRTYSSSGRMVVHWDSN